MPNFYMKPSDDNIALRKFVATSIITYQHEMTLKTGYLITLKQRKKCWHGRLTTCYEVQKKQFK